VCIAKGLGAGYQPIGAVIASTRVFDTIVEGTGFFQHGHTYTGHPTACAAALAVQTAIRDERLLTKVGERGRQLKERLEARFGGRDYVGDIRGRGLFLAVEFVADRASKAPFMEPGFAAQLKKTALAKGLVCYPMGGLVDGRLGDHVMLAPPYIVDESHLDEIVDKLDSAIDETLRARR
ncbi:MAG: aminotransferase class III-fold pyridoxal phosphate-dependent enzyme, partial [Hyphomicrobiales bacterium]